MTPAEDTKRINAIGHIAMSQLASTPLDGLALVMARGVVGTFPLRRANPSSGAFDPFQARIQKAIGITRSSLFLIKERMSGSPTNKQILAGEKIARALIANAKEVYDNVSSTS